MAHKDGFEGYGVCVCCRKRRALKRLVSGKWECKRCIEGACDCATKEETSMELTAGNVVMTVRGCLFDTAPEDLSKVVKVEGVVRTFGFDPERLKAKEADIVAMLRQLPSKFMADGGGGYTFMAATNRADGVQWADEHRVMEELFCLGMAIGKVQSCLPRDLWPSLPGGMPYYVVTL